MPRQQALVSLTEDTPPPSRRRPSPRTPPAIPLFDHAEEAEAYARRGMSVIPLLPGKKGALVKWKSYQTCPAAEEQIDAWWRRWPDAGVAVVLGPVSELVVVDVDGPEAHDAWVRRLGGEPVAPKVLTGSGKPFRYHLFFRHPPGLVTIAKYTPWHLQLEFRGRGGMAVLPPSVHPSGRRYLWAPGRSLDELDPPPLPPAVLEALRARHTPVDPATDRGTRLEIVPAPGLSQVQRRALALINEHQAVQGRGGDKVTFTVACYLVRDFGLTVDQALPLMRAWNDTHCHPPWDDEALYHKLDAADDFHGVRGRLLVEASGQEPSTTSRPTIWVPSSGHSPSVVQVAPLRPNGQTRGGPAFAVPVPDSCLGDWDMFRPRQPRTRPGPGRPATRGLPLLALAWSAVVFQKSSSVRLPDVALGQLVWGGDRAGWPRRWRTALARHLSRLARLGVKVRPRTRSCKPGCPLFERGDLSHRDVRLRVKSPLLPLFAVRRTEKGVVEYEFSGLRSHHPDLEIQKANTTAIRKHRRTGRLCAVYLPAWVFGPRVLGHGPCRVLQALTRELTRQRKGCRQRADNAELVDGASCPLLDPGRRYVGFNGNAGRKRPQFHGYGYTLGQWMKRAGLPADPADPGYRAAAAGFLADLGSLLGPFGLVAAVRLPERAGWCPLDRAAAELDVVRPRRMATGCLVRVYGPEDYPARWRAYFAAELGLGVIPAGLPGEALPAEGEPGGAAIRTGEQLARWMKANGWTDGRLAARLGVSRTLVCRCRTGERRLTGSFQEKLMSLAAG